MLSRFLYCIVPTTLKENIYKQQQIHSCYISVFSYYVFINKKEKQLQEQHISTILPNYVDLPGNHTVILHLIIWFNTM